MAAEPKLHWYAMRAVSGKEANLKDYIEKELAHNPKLAQHVKDILLPTEKHAIMRGTKRVVKDKVALPGYLFVRAQLVGDTAHTLRFMPNCLGFLGGLDSPTPVKDADIDAMLGKADQTQLEAKTDIPYIVGESVKVTDGPFSGFTGTIETINTERQLLKVIVKIFGRDTPVDLSYTQVEHIVDAE